MIKENFIKIYEESIGYADESLKGMGELLSNEIEKLSGIKLASASDKESVGYYPRFVSR